MPKLKNSPAPALPVDAFFYAIPLKNGKQELTTDMLNEHFVLKMAKDLGTIDVSYIRYFDGIATLEVTTSEPKKFTIFLRVSPDVLEVACTCGMAGHVLCEHAYSALLRLLYRDNQMDLGRFYWPGFHIDQNGYNKFLNIEINPHLMFVEPRYGYGRIFKSQTGFNTGEDFSLKHLTLEPAPKTPLNFQIAYFIDRVFCGFSSTNQLLLKPALVIADNKNERVISFKEFFLPNDQLPDVICTPNYKSLNLLCFEMLSIAAQLSELRKDKEQIDRLKIEMFEQWKAAFPLLEAQKLIFSAINAENSQKGNKPNLQKISAVTFSNQRPLISFMISEQNDHFTVRSVLSINGLRLKPSASYKPDFITYDQKSSTCYLLDIGDDDLINWLYEENNKLTILKMHFPEFLRDYLIPLSKRYKILHRPVKSAKLCPFIFDNYKDS